MPHHPKPFCKPHRNTWDVEVARVQHPLGKHLDGLTPLRKCDGCWDPPREILHAYHRIMAQDHHAPDTGPLTGETPPPVALVLDEFVG